jgi:hypothetical protein
LKQWILSNHAVVAYFAPRGIGLSAWNSDERVQTHIRRRFMLLGQTLDSMRVWDIRRAVQTLRTLSYTNPPVALQAEGPMAVNVLYASLFEPVADLQLWALPSTHVQGPDYLNIMRSLDVPQALFLSLKQRRVHLHDVNKEQWQPLLHLTKRPDFWTQFNNREGRAPLVLD